MNSKLVIVIAMCAIGLGVYGLTSSEPEKKVAPAVEVQEQKLKVFVASQDISKGDEITRDKVSIEWVSVSEANLKGIDKDLVLTFDTINLARNNIIKNRIIYPESVVTPESQEYLDFITTPGFVPFPLEVDTSSIIGGVIHSGTLVDVLALASTQQNMAETERVSQFKGITLTPVLMSIKVLRVSANNQESEVVNKELAKNKSDNKALIVLELTQKQVATLTIAKRIAQLEVHKSLGNPTKQQLSADAGDVLEDYRAIKEFRAEEAKIN
jgi:pilus assembly protein CpaB